MSQNTATKMIEHLENIDKGLTALREILEKQNRQSQMIREFNKQNSNQTLHTQFPVNHLLDTAYLPTAN